MGIDRKTLLKNRMISSIIWMSISCVIPLAVSLLANYLNFSITSETIKTAIYLSLCFFLNMLLGYGIAGSIMLSVGNVIEGVGIYAIIIISRNSKRTVGFRIQFAGGQMIMMKRRRPDFS